MRAAWYDRTGPAAEVLELGEMPRPEPGPGEVLVRVHASGINPADVKRRAGWGGGAMSAPRVIPHCDGAGVIEDLGPGIDHTYIGRRVWLWNAQGGYGEAGRAHGTAADYIALPAAQAVLLDETFSFAEGACLGVPAMTAWWALHAGGPVAGCRVLIQGAAGAVGLCAVQIALAAGAHVVATVSHEAGREYVTAHGGEAAHLVDRTLPDLIAQLREANGGHRFDRIVEVDLAANLDTDLSVLASHGILSSYSCSSDPTPVLPYYRFADLGAHLHFVQGFRIPDAARAEGQVMLADLGRRGLLHLPIRNALSLSEIVWAHDAVASGGLGQVVLDLDADADADDTKETQ